MTNRRARSGFTIVEVLVAMVAGLLVLGGIYQLLSQNQRVYKAQSELAETQQLVRTAMDIMSRDIRQAGADQSRSIFAGAPSDNTYGVPYKGSDAISVMMDLPRDSNGDGDTYDIIDLDGDGIINYGDTTRRGEDEMGDGVVGDNGPDEWVTYFYCQTPASQSGTQDIDNTVGDDITCPVNETLRLYRMVTYFDNNGVRHLLTEPLADYIEPDEGIFSYLCWQTSPPTFVTCNLNNEKPDAVGISLRGRTRSPDPTSHGYKYFKLEAQVRLLNLGGTNI